MVKYRDRRVAQEILKEVNDILHKKCEIPVLKGRLLLKSTLRVIYNKLRFITKTLG